MLGDVDYNQTITNALDSISRDIAPHIDPKNNKEIDLSEVTKCLRRSYFDRIDPEETPRKSFRMLIGGLLRKMSYGSKQGEFLINEIKLKGQADMIVDDIVFILKWSDDLLEEPLAEDILYLNACLWIFNKMEGILVYLTKKGEVPFSLTKSKKMFEETIRRVKVFNDLLEEKKIPILEPSIECSTCQYYERCYMKKKVATTISFSSLFGVKEKEN